MLSFSGKKIMKKSFFFVLLLALIGLIGYPIFQQMKSSQSEEQIEGQTAQQVNNAINTELVLVTHYVAGNDTIETKTEDINALEDVENRFPGWEIVEINQDQIVLERSVEDLSPDLKKAAYFGLGADGYLTLYQGNPEVNQVIETFFRIDIEKLESGLPREPVKQLYQGIPVQDLAEYNSVLSTFSEFSVD